MKSIILGCVLISLSLTTFSQIELSDEFDYSVSTPYPVIDGYKTYFSKDDQVLTFKYNRGNFYFKKFSGEKFNTTQENVVPKGPEKFSPEECLVFGDRYYFFFSRWDEDAEIEKLFVREIDFDNATFAGDEQLLITVKGKVEGWGLPLLGNSFNVGTKFQMNSSFDNQTLLIQYKRYKPILKRDKNYKGIVGAHVYDVDMNEVWNDNFEMPYSEKKMNNLDYVVDSKGNTYVLAEVFKNETTRRTVNGEPNYQLEIIKIDLKNNNTSTSIVELKDKFIKDVKFFEGLNNQIIVAGYYGSRFNKGVDGVFYSKLDDQGNIISQYFAEIPVEIITLYNSDMKQSMIKSFDKYIDVSMKDMVLRNVIFDKEGGVTFYGEKYYVSTNSHSTNSVPIPMGGPTTGNINNHSSTSYCYKEILAAKLDDQGNVLWMNKLPKNQSGKKNPGGMGFHLMTSESFDYILFLDNIKNIELPLNKYPKRHVDGKGGFLTGFKVNKEDGALEKISVLDTRNANGIALYQFNTGRIIPLSDNSFGLECYKKKKEDVMIKVELND